MIDFQLPDGVYRHWRLEIAAPVAQVFMQVDEAGGLFDGYALKLNSYDLGVDIELADIVQRLRFEHPDVRVVVLRSAQERVFCAGANIRMLASASHALKVNFCKFTNETRNAIEAAGTDSGQHWVCAVEGSCAGGGYELALACDEILLLDDASSGVSLPEVPLLAVLPGTGGLTRVTDKRNVRRDIADVFCTVEEGVRGEKALRWGLVDAVAKRSRFDDELAEITTKWSEQSTRSSSDDATAQPLVALTRDNSDPDSIRYSTVAVTIDRAAGRAEIMITGPTTAPPTAIGQWQTATAEAWLFTVARELDDALLHLRFNELDIGLLVFRSTGDPQQVLAHEQFLLSRRDNWLANEVLQYWKRVLKRVDLTSRTLVALVENGSCFAGMLAELVFAVDRSYMMAGEFEELDPPPATLSLNETNFAHLPMSNGLSRLATRFWGHDSTLAKVQALQGSPLDAAAADEAGLVTFAFDDIDWEDEVRIFLEERASFSADALTAMEANLRFAGPETMETRIFGRLTAWQNWVFQRPNAVGENGALQRYGSGKRADFDRNRV